MVRSQLSPGSSSCLRGITLAFPLLPEVPSRCPPTTVACTMTYPLERPPSHLTSLLPWRVSWHCLLNSVLAPDPSLGISLGAGDPNSNNRTRSSGGADVTLSPLFICSHCSPPSATRDPGGAPDKSRYAQRCSSYLSPRCACYLEGPSPALPRQTSWVCCF